MCFSKLVEGIAERKVPPAYSRAEDNARSLDGRRDDDAKKDFLFAGSHARSLAADPTHHHVNCVLRRDRDPSRKLGMFLRNLNQRLTLRQHFTNLHGGYAGGLQSTDQHSRVVASN